MKKFREIWIEGDTILPIFSFDKKVPEARGARVPRSVANAPHFRDTANCQSSASELNSFRFPVVSISYAEPGEPCEAPSHKHGPKPPHRLRNADRPTYPERCGDDSPDIKREVEAPVGFFWVRAELILISMRCFRLQCHEAADHPLSSPLSLARMIARLH